MWNEAAPPGASVTSEAGSAVYGNDPPSTVRVRTLAPWVPTSCSDG